MGYLGSLTEFIKTRGGQAWRCIGRNEPVLEQGVLTEKKEEFFVCGSICFQRERLRISENELDQLHYPHLPMSIDSMKLLLLPPSSWLVPHAIQILFINLIREKTIPVKFVQRI